MSESSSVARQIDPVDAKLDTGVLRRIRACGWLAGLLVVACDRGTHAPGGVDMQRMPAGSSPQPAVAAPAPDGQRVALADIVLADASGARAPLRARMRDVTVLAFSASWCRPCQMELPQLEQFALGEHDPRVAVIAVNIDALADRAAALAVIAVKHLTMPVVFDPDQAAYEAAIGDDIQIPALAIVGKHGVETEIGFEQGRTAPELAAHLRARIAAQLQ